MIGRMVFYRRLVAANAECLILWAFRGQTQYIEF